MYLTKCCDIDHSPKVSCEDAAFLAGDKWSDEDIDKMRQKQFFMVWSPTGRPPTYRHEYPADAEHEAERLAKLNPGEQFYVLCAYQRYETVKPVINTELESVIPF